MPRCFFVAGRPISHSLSPMLFRAFAEDGGYEMYYTRAVCRDEHDIAILLEHGFHGCNITSPLKETVLSLPYPKTQIAEAIRAANVIFAQDGSYVLHNTDVDAVHMILESLNISSDSRILVLGAGGAGRAAAFAALRKGFHVTLTNRTYHRAIHWSQLLGCSVVPWQKMSDCIRDIDIVINAQPDTSVLQEFVAAGKVIIDALYHIDVSEKERLHSYEKYVNGLQWLAWQAVTGFTFLTGKYVAPELLFDALKYQKPRKKLFPIVLIGMMKSGKTVTGRILSELMQVDFFDLDDLIEERAGKSIETIFLEDGEARFREVESAVFEELVNNSTSRQVIAAGGGLVLREHNRQLLKNNCYTVWLFAPPAELQKRQDHVSRPLLKENEQEQLHHLHYQRFSHYCQCADIVIPSYNASPREVAHLILEELLHLERPTRG